VQGSSFFTAESAAKRIQTFTLAQFHGDRDMSDSMLSTEERDRFNRRGGENGPIKFNRTGIAITLALSKTLRRLWLCSSLIALLAIPGGLLWLNAIANAKHPQSTDAWQAWALIVSGLSFIWGLWGLGLWMKALLVRWIGRKVQQDYEDDELFDR
jgi:hypothetical protein